MEYLQRNAVLGCVSSGCGLWRMGTLVHHDRVPGIVFQERHQKPRGARLPNHLIHPDIMKDRNFAKIYN